MPSRAFRHRIDRGPDPLEPSEGRACKPKFASQIYVGRYGIEASFWAPLADRALSPMALVNSKFVSTFLRQSKAWPLNPLSRWRHTAASQSAFCTLEVATVPSESNTATPIIGSIGVSQGLRAKVRTVSS